MLKKKSNITIEQLKIMSEQAQTRGALEIYKDIDIKSHLSSFKGMEEEMVRRLVNHIIKLSNEKIELYDRLIEKVK